MRLLNYFQSPENIYFKYNALFVFVSVLLIRVASVYLLLSQENNAIATLNMTTHQFMEIYSLGEKSWAKGALDPSDKDGGK